MPHGGVQILVVFTFHCTLSESERKGDIHFTCKLGVIHIEGVFVLHSSAFPLFSYVNVPDRRVLLLRLITQ